MTRLAALLDGVSRADLARRSAAITQAYRAGAGSEIAVRDRLDALAYATARMPATRAAVSEALSRLIEARPTSIPRACSISAAAAAPRVWPRATPSRRSLA